MLTDAYDLGADKLAVWKEMLKDEDRDVIKDAVIYMVKHQNKNPKIADLIAIIDKISEDRKKSEVRKEAWTGDDLLNEIIKANSKNMEVVVERREDGRDIIYWESPYFIPKECKRIPINNYFFYRKINARND